MITIDFNDIFERCRRETAYIGRDHAFADSDKLRATTDDKTFSPQYAGQFHLIRIRGSDKTRIDSFINEGAHIVEAAIGWALQGRGQYTLQAVAWQFRPNILTGNDTLQVAGLIEDILTHYTIFRWLNTKDNNTADTYETLWRQATKNINLTLFNSSTPTKRKPYNYENTSQQDNQRR